jgi:tetratricopeptide (TPR) repeat protein
VRVNQATGYILAGKPGQAIPHAQEALKLFDQFGQPFGQAVAHTALAEAYLANGEVDDALVHVELAYRTEEMRTAPDVLRIEGEVRLIQGEPHAAERLIRQAIDEADNNKDRYLGAYTRRALGKVYLAQGKAAEAQNVLCQSIEFFEGLGLAWEAEATRRLMPADDAEGETDS